MIFPFLYGIVRFKNAPVTWCLVVMNLFVFSVLQADHVSQKAYEEILKDDTFLVAQGRFFAQYVVENRDEFTATINQLADLSLGGKDEQSILLGSLAMREKKFMESVSSFVFVGDQVMVEWWKAKFLEVHKIQHSHPSFALGLSWEAMEAPRWLTYQFVHSGGVHLTSNMLFLLIFGGALELSIGGLGLLIVYLGTGLVAAGFFLMISGGGAVPLIGASGAVSGIMALFCFMHWSEKMRYIYFLFIPHQNYYGFAWLPAWVTLFLWGASDFAGYLSSVNELGGVAYTAHIGGQLSGVLVGAAVFLFRQTTKTLPTPADNSESVVPAA